MNNYTRVENMVTNFRKQIKDLNFKKPFMIAEQLKRADRVLEGIEKMILLYKWHIDKRKRKNPNP